MLGSKFAKCAIIFFFFNAEFDADFEFVGNEINNLCKQLKMSLVNRESHARQIMFCNTIGKTT